MSKAPADAPPSYATATGSSTKSSTLQVPNSGVNPAHRRSMEDEQRPLPVGWVRQFDAHENHQFFVDTRANPPRSIWHHPYDDDEYLKSISSEERERIQEEERERMVHYDASTDEEGPSKMDTKKPTVAAASASGSSSSFPQNLPNRPDNSRKDSKHKVSLGERLKEKVTGQTKEERAREKALREEEERRYEEAHMKFRAAMQKAAQTGQPVWLAKDKDGKDVYVEPPQASYAGNYGQGGYGLNPYTNGPYSTANARFIRPSYAYARPGYGGYGGYGYGGYGGMGGYGMGMPLAGGLMGGMLLGGLLF